MTPSHYLKGHSTVFGPWTWKNETDEKLNYLAYNWSKDVKFHFSERIICELSLVSVQQHFWVKNCKMSVTEGTELKFSYFQHYGNFNYKSSLDIICGFILSSLDKKNNDSVFLISFYDSVKLKLSRLWQKIYKYFFWKNIKQPTNVQFIFLLLGPYLSLVPSK